MLSSELWQESSPQVLYTGTGGTDTRYNHHRSSSEATLKDGVVEEDFAATETYLPIEEVGTDEVFMENALNKNEFTKTLIKCVANSSTIDNMVTGGGMSYLLLSLF